MIAVAVGLLLVSVPLVAFEFWLNGFIDRQAQAEIAMGGRRAVALAETRLDQARDALDAVAKRGIQVCDAAAVTAMRQAAFEAASVKDVMLLGPAGKPLCSGNNVALGPFRLLSHIALPEQAGFSLDVLQFADGSNMLELRRNTGAGPGVLAALIPTSLLMPQATIRGTSIKAYVWLADNDGRLVGWAGAPAAAREPHFSIREKSVRYGITVGIVVPRAIIPAAHGDVRFLSKLAIGVLAVVLIAFGLLLRRRSLGNPITEMKRALKAGQFVPYYQPIIDISSGQLRGAEVLVRWRKPDGTLVLPGAFIPLAESSGMIRDMTNDLMRRVRAEAGEAVGRRPGLKIAFNFAGQLFSDPSIVKDVSDVFADGPIRYDQVVLEVTERDPIENFTETRQTIAALQGLGVRIAIDDVGTGHSGLSYMLKLGVDIIKIDKMFVDAVGTDQNATTIVEMLIDLARNMRMDIVAEGVENFEQVMYLRERGVRQAQGYVFAPPLPGRSFLQLIESIDPLPKASRADGAGAGAEASRRLADGAQAGVAA